MLITLPKREGKFAIFDSKFGRGKDLGKTLKFQFVARFYAPYQKSQFIGSSTLPRGEGDLHRGFAFQKTGG